jgi:hypothetical protein
MKNRERGKKKERKKREKGRVVRWVARKGRRRKEGRGRGPKARKERKEKRKSDKVRHVAQCEWPGEDEDILSSQPDDATWQRSIVLYFKPSTYINYYRTH